MGCNHHCSNHLPVFIFMAAALVAVMFANVDYDEMEVGKTNKRTESISKTTNKRK